MVVVGALLRLFAWPVLDASATGTRSEAMWVGTLVAPWLFARRFLDASATGMMSEAGMVVVGAVLRLFARPVLDASATGARSEAEELVVGELCVGIIIASTSWGRVPATKSCLMK